jgi:hypothetical protein
MQSPAATTRSSAYTVWHQVKALSQLLHEFEANVGYWAVSSLRRVALSDSCYKFMCVCVGGSVTTLR